MFPDTAFCAASNRDSVTFLNDKPGAGIEKSDVYINKCQRECVVQCQI